MSGSFIIKKALDGNVLSADEIAQLFSAPLFSSEAAEIQAASRQLSERLSDGLAEVHAQME